MRALVLLGEPGVGKSAELKKELARRAVTGDDVILVDLGEYTTVGEVESAIQQAVTAWKARATAELTLAFDGFDEPLLSISNLSDVLKRELEKLDLARLRVMIASRGAQWQTVLTDTFEGWWPTAVVTLVLAPLTESDIRAAASTELEDVDGFIEATHAASGEPLSAWPITLRLLLAAARQGRFPERRVDVYRAGIEGLAAETGRRRDRRQDGPPLPRRLAAAQKLAAIGLLTGRSAIVRRTEPGADSNILALDQVMSDDVTLVELEAVYDSALLVGDGEARRWTHRTVEEYLCAIHLHELPLRTALSLLADPGKPSQLLPQMVEAAGWLAALRDDAFDWLVDHQPTALLTPDLRSRPDYQRARVAKALIDGMVDGEPIADRVAYDGLAYTGLASDLAPLLAPTEPDWRQREAVVIISRTGIRELDEQLVAIIELAAAEHGSHEYTMKVITAELAVSALGTVSETDLVERLVTIATDPTCPWPLRAALIGNLWPQHLDTAQLFATISEYDRGTRSRFGRRLTQIFYRAIQEGSAKPSEFVDWVAHLSSSDHHEPAVGRVISALAIEVIQSGEPGDQAWQTAVAGVTGQLGATRPLPGLREADVTELPDERRRLFVRDLLMAARATRAVEITIERLHRRLFIVSSDLGWWVDHLVETYEEGDEPSVAIAVLKRLAWDATDDELNVAYQRDNVPSAARVVLDAVFGEQARAERALAREDEARRAAEAEADKHAEQFSASRFADAIAAADFGLLATELDREVEGSETTNWPGRAWGALDADQRRQAANLAIDFLASIGDPAGKPNTLGRAAVAHAVAGAVDRALVGQVTPQAWLTMLPSLLSAPGCRDVTLEALPHAHQLDPEATTRYLVEQLKSDAARGSVLLIEAQQLMRIERLSEEALKWVEDPNLDRRGTTSLLVLAATTHPEQATELAIRLIGQLPAPTGSSPTDADAAERDNQARRTAVMAATALTSIGLSAPAFELLLHAFASDTAFAQEVIREADRIADWRSWTGLTNAQITELYMWAEKDLPHEQIAPPGGITQADPVGEFRSNLIRRLIAAGDEEAASALEDLSKRTDNVWLRSEANKIRDARRADDWSPPSPSEVLELTTHPDKRIIATREQLAELVLDVLDEIAQELQRDRGLLTDLWPRQRVHNKWVGRVPVDENALSTWLSRQLQTRLSSRVAILREVEVQPRLSGAIGDIPDLLVVLTTKRGVLTLPIEVKGNWHAEVTTAIEDQLADRYLQGPNGTIGIYIVGFFAGSDWSDSDQRRRSDAGRIGHEDLTTQLKARAASLAERGLTTHLRVIDLSLAHGEPDATANWGAAAKKAPAKKAGAAKAAAKKAPAKKAGAAKAAAKKAPAKKAGPAKAAAKKAPAKKAGPAKAAAKKAPAKKGAGAGGRSSKRVAAPGLGRGPAADSSIRGKAE
ncbi:hypothetical protein EV644_103107 [Kribbella orskensis]|uniref:ATP-binding protein n=2 Tax=Kribbellaceae TaxID=2726069 RepID=A0ABY2BPN4_9ACTN|nr:hypothetical protein EV642_106313 [Kribbella sp. VKM Ac-2500]TCO27410.1 hypothetical protein EV644_103107 [Kribbella orskensis]